MRLLPLLLLTGLLPGCATPGEGTPRGMSAAAGRAGAPCVLHATKDGSDAACAGRGGRAVTAALAPKPVGPPSGHVVEAGPVVAGTGAGGATLPPPGRVRGAVTPVVAPGADLAPSPVPDDDAPFITMVPNPFRPQGVAPEPVRGASRPTGQRVL